MTESAYDTRPYADHDYPSLLWVLATWSPRDGGPARATRGDYANIWEDGEVRLNCGVTEAAYSLGLGEVLESDEDHIIELIDRQLIRRPVAELVCPAGVLRLELVRP